MSEHGTLVAVIILIGGVLVFSSLLTTPWVYAGKPLPPDSTWGQISSQVSSFPQFQNPFDTKGTVELSMAADGNSTPPASVHNSNPTNVTNCTQSSSPSSNWWGCLNSADSNVSYVSTNATHDQFKTKLQDATGADLASTVVTLLVMVQCRATVNAVNVKVDFAFMNVSGSTFEVAQYLTCFPGAFANQTLRQDFTAVPRGNVQQYSAAQIMLITESPGNNNADFSYLHVELWYTSPDCNSADTLGYIGCLFRQGLQFVFNIGLFLINGLIFIGAVLFWFVMIMATFVGSIGTIFTYPGEPPLIQALFGIGTIVVLFTVLFIIISRVRGVGSGVG